MSYRTLLKTVSAGGLLALATGLPAQAVVFHVGSGTIDGSLCVGLDCPASPAFGFDTIRMQENNLRLHFDDTSVAAAFPPNDWRLYANDSANGGSSYFGVEDATAGRFVFRVFAGARSNALTVDSQGDVGLGTTTPALDIDIKTGDTPSIRLQQDGTSGFTPQSWDMAGNEVNWFVRDATSGSTLPLRIRVGAPTSSIDIATDGDVGMGTASPGGALHVSRTTGAAAIMLRLSNNNRPIIDLDNTNVAGGEGLWKVSSANNGDFEINNDAISGAIPVEFDLDKNGNLTLAGTVTAPSSRHFKADLDVVDSMEVLAKLDAMPIVTWHYKNQSADNRHMGPVAEDFYEAFGLGESEEFIALNDLSGVALAAIKALNEKVGERDAQIEAMADQIALLTKMVSGSGDAGAITLDE